MTITVGSIQNYAPGQTWFDLSRYQNLAVQERVSINLSSSNLWLIDSSHLFLNNTYAPRIAFLNEGAGYQSPVKLTATGATNGGATVFQNLSGSNSILPSANAPLKLGDWVQISTIQAGTQLNLSVIPNGVSQPKNTPLSTDPSLNPVSVYNPNSPVFWTAYADPSATRPLIILGYEDIWGRSSDNDFNDGILALDVGPDNFRAILTQANLGQDASVNLREAQPVSVPFELNSALGLAIATLIVGKKIVSKQTRSKQVD
ncbi:MAG: DUF4114 domain-containing protein [Oculatellaceae cyanobacterium bins.114]|nr:DUF4114 domain-containing protein [Oculatellaceae cyanobacterium bins.114]